jgi:5'-nucleotidase / UDP-sugar diphosphatase
MKISTKLFALISIALLFSTVVVFAQTASLTILHTNDTHGRLLPFSYPNTVPPGSDYASVPVRSNIGGIARRATIAKQVREELGRQGTPVWMMDAGDFSDGTPFSIEYHGEADALAMNAAGYDFGTLGNHEFNNPLPRLRSIIKLFQYPVLCANAIDNSTGAPFITPYEIRDLGPLKIGIFGLVTHSANGYPATQNALTVADEIETAKRMVKELRSKADIIIALSHSGEDVDQQIAAAVPEIDIIVGGHSHSRLPVGEFVWHSADLRSDEVNGTVIVQAHQWGGELGRLDLLFGKDKNGAWRVERYRERLIPVTSKISEDPAVAAVIDKYWKPIAERYGKIIGQAATDFVERGDDLTNYNLMTDAIRETFKSQIVLENMGGVRAPLVKGDITFANLVDMDPFDNTIVTFKISGRQLKEILKSERSAVSGMRYRMEGDTITEVTVAGKPLNESRIYAGAANSFFARTVLKGIAVNDTHKPRLDVLTEYVQKKGTVRPVYDGRRVIVNQ